MSQASEFKMLCVRLCAAINEGRTGPDRLTIGNMARRVLRIERVTQQHVFRDQSRLIFSLIGDSVTVNDARTAERNIRMKYKKAPYDAAHLSSKVRMDKASRGRFYQMCEYKNEPQRRAILQCTHEAHGSFDKAVFINFYTGSSINNTRDGSTMLYELDAKCTFTRTTIDGAPERLR